ncbi:MAG: hypothetical protein ACI8Y4_001041 [Candidatus Poriferisodalaceae bacterium]|jgi:hypothetical protein
MDEQPLCRVLNHDSDHSNERLNVEIPDIHQPGVKISVATIYRSAPQRFLRLEVVVDLRLMGLCSPPASLLVIRSNDTQW